MCTFITMLYARVRTHYVYHYCTPGNYYTREISSKTFILLSADLAILASCLFSFILALFRFCSYYFAFCGLVIAFCEVLQSHDHGKVYGGNCPHIELRDISSSRFPPKALLYEVNVTKLSKSLTANGMIFGRYTLKGLVAWQKLSRLNKAKNFKGNFCPTVT